jgi:hypothetical protein
MIRRANVGGVFAQDGKDPTIFTGPWTASYPLTANQASRVTVGHLFEYACHEGNYALPNILAGARARERGVDKGVVHDRSK